MRKTRYSLLLILLLITAVTPVVYGEPASRQARLTIGLLPILDVLPFYVAEQAGYFAQEGLDIEPIPVSSALERDQLMLAGEIDGMVNDLVSTGIFNQNKSRIVVVALARKAYVGYPQFRILAAPDSDITTPDDLKDVDIGISENSVIYYITQRILEHAGLSVDDLDFRPEPNIAVRFQLLMEGQLKAACLPDPLAQAAIVSGATLIADDTVLVDTDFSQSTLSFSAETVENQPEAIEGFLRAWMRAAEDINADPDAYRDLWIENTQVPDSVKDTYALPPFPTYQITGEAAWIDTMDWLLDLNIIDTAPDYADSVDGSFITAIMLIEG
jgi:NitT/TauT family transport system substrate-binding protein